MEVDGPAAATSEDQEAVKQAAAVNAAAGGAGDGGSGKSISGWQQDEQGWWHRKLAATNCVYGSAARMRFPRHLSRELTGRAPADKDQLAVFDAGGQQYSFQLRIRAYNEASELTGAQLGQWAASCGAQAGDTIAFRRSGGQVQVRLVPASAAAAGEAAVGSPPPAPSAAEAGAAGTRRSRRSNSEQQEAQGGALPDMAAALVGRNAAGGKGGKRPSSEQQEAQGGAPADVAAGGGRRRGSKRHSNERQEQQGGAAAAADAATARAAGGSKGGSKRSGRPQQHGQGSAPGTGAAAAGSTDEHFASGSKNPHKGWQLDADGWWRRPLTASACGTSGSARTGVKLGFPAVLYQTLMDEEPDNAEDLAVVDSRTGEQLIFLYRKDTSGGGSNITGAALAQWLSDAGAQEGDFLALRHRGSKLEVRHVPAGSAAAGSRGPAATAAAGGGSSVMRRTSSKEEGEAAAGAAMRKPPGRAPKVVAELEAQGPTRAAGASRGSRAPPGVESDLSGDALRGCRIAVLWSKEKQWYSGMVVDYNPSKRRQQYSVEYDDGDFQEENLRAGEWRLLEEAGHPPAAAEEQQQQEPQQPAAAGAAVKAEVQQPEQARQPEQAQRAAGGRRGAAGSAGQARSSKRQRQPAAEPSSAAASDQPQQEQAEAAEDEPSKKRQRKSRTAAAAADELAAQRAEQADHAKQQGPPAEQQAQQEQAEQAQGQPRKQPQRGKPASKEAAQLLQPGQDAAALLQSGRTRRKAAEAAKAGVQANLRAEQDEEGALPALPPEVPGAAPVALAPAAAEPVAAAPRAAEAIAGAAAAAAAAGAAPAMALVRQSSNQRRRASSAAKSRAAGAAAQQAAPFNQSLPRNARAPEVRGQYERNGLTITSCHDCQEPCFVYPCQSGLGKPTCNKTYCPKCTELYRYLLAFGPEHPEQYQLRRRFVAGHCPCCLRICLRSKCRQKSLRELGGEAPMPQDSVSRQIVFAYHLARRLLPAVEHIMALQQQEAQAARISLQAAQLAEIGYVGTQRAPHSERALCNRCATCLENLHFHCDGCDQDICPLCARETRKGKAQAAVKCSNCGTAMQPMRFLDNRQLEMLQQARQRLDAALGGGPSGGTSAAAASAASLPGLLWNLCKGSCGCEHERAEWIEPEKDWLQQMRQAAAFAARYAPPALVQQQQPQQEQQAQPPPQQQQPEQQQAARQAPQQQQQAGGQQRSGWNAGTFIRQAEAEQQQQQQQQQQPANGLAAAVTQAAFAAALAQQEPQVASAAVLAGQQQHAQQQRQLQAIGALLLQPSQTNGGALQQQAQTGRGRPAEGPAEEGAEARPKRQRKVSAKLRGASEEEEGQVAGQQRQLQQAGQPAPAPAAAGTAGPAAAAASAGQQQLPSVCVPRELTPMELHERQWWWLAEQLPETDVRVASYRGTQDFIWTPHADQFLPEHPRFQRTIRIFQMLWERGEPIIVRGLRGSMGWTPEAMGRVCKESKSTKLNVLACSDGWQMLELTPRDFFERYKLCSGDTLSADNQEPLPMLKLKDFPPSSDFKQVMARHHDDFVQLLNRCLPAYTHPTSGALNLACHLPWYTRLPDLGPKGYIAFGREEEHQGEGDSVTKMHEDLSDAINIMLHVQHRPGAPPAPPRCGYAEAAAPGYGGAGAVWDLVRREDRPALRHFFTDALAGKVQGCPPFVHKGRVLTPADVHDVMHDQCFMLTAKHRELLQREPYGVHVWHVEQYEHEAVWIPGGCAHQVRNLRSSIKVRNLRSSIKVRNLRSSIKVALDFVSPDAVHECLELRGEFRQGALRELELWQAENPGQAEEDVGSRHYADKLQIGNMVLHGFLHSLTVLEAVAAGRFDAIPRFPPPLEAPWRDPEEVEEAVAAASKPRRQRQRQREDASEEEEEGFYAAVEQQRNPSLRGKPVGVVQYNPYGSLETRGPDENRLMNDSNGSLIAVSYEARAHGVKRNMRGDDARKACPDIQLVQVPTAHGKADLTLYRSEGKKVLQILSRLGIAERASIDECYLDLTAEAQRRLEACGGVPPLPMHPDQVHVSGAADAASWWQRPPHEWQPGERLLACAAAAVAELRQAVREELGYTCSAGIAHTKLMAKLCSGLHKPAQQTVLPASGVPDLLAPLPVSKLRGLGGKFGEQVCSELGITTVGELAAVPLPRLESAFGDKDAQWLYAVARGVTDDAVQERTLPKSLNCGKTFRGRTSLRSMEAVHKWLLELAGELSERLEQEREDNNRVPQLLTVNLASSLPWTVSKNGSIQAAPGYHSVSRSYPLRKYNEPAAMADDAAALVRRWTAEQGSGWSISSLFITAGNFVPVQSPSSAITRWFKPAGAAAAAAGAAGGEAEDGQQREEKVEQQQEEPQEQLPRAAGPFQPQQQQVQQVQGPSPQQAQQQQAGGAADTAAPSGSRSAASGSSGSGGGGAQGQQQQQQQQQQLYGQQPVDESVLAELPPDLQKEIRAQMKAEQMAARFGRPKPAGGSSAGGGAGTKRPASRGGGKAEGGTQRIDAFLRRPKK
ncbi:DNA polymerase eta isoform B [Chlorella sorokiniana]|uniref:DNA polymerase eta n=1 Tax=Chlorella sorokiniana TaxID=3076 RepID=A0A2P6TXF4_CHLSO|nr:DNA polymerase eta isoform B [Chlorella sorokiniana]|eukprot:PRW58740.1 DNA polymerase eta isoform B [Chlorella sorokiniana]